MLIKIEQAEQEYVDQSDQKLRRYWLRKALLEDTSRTEAL